MGNLTSRDPQILVPVMKPLAERKKFYKRVEKAIPARSKKAIRNFSELLEKIIKDVKDRQKPTGGNILKEMFGFRPIDARAARPIDARAVRLEPPPPPPQGSLLGPFYFNRNLDEVEDNQKRTEIGGNLFADPFGLRPTLTPIDARAVRHDIPIFNEKDLKRTVGKLDNNFFSRLIDARMVSPANPPPQGSLLGPFYLNSNVKDFQQMSGNGMYGYGGNLQTRPIRGEPAIPRMPGPRPMPIKGGPARPIRGGPAIPPIRGPRPMPIKGGPARPPIRGGPAIPPIREPMLRPMPISGQPSRVVGEGLKKSRKGNSNARARGQMVSQIMKSEGLTLGQASKKLASMNK
tara:strand:- start:129 stop:1169 length:1041 start_codon:yes stop_codon:yes gene_type:complete